MAVHSIAPLSALFANVTLLLSIVVTFQNKIVIITLFTLCLIAERLVGPSRSVTTTNKNFNSNITGLRILTSLRWNSLRTADAFPVVASLPPTWNASAVRRLKMEQSAISRLFKFGSSWTNPASVKGGSAGAVLGASGVQCSNRSATLFPPLFRSIEEKRRDSKAQTARGYWLWLVVCLIIIFSSCYVFSQ